MNIASEAIRSPHGSARNSGWFSKLRPMGARAVGHALGLISEDRLIYVSIGGYASVAALVVWATGASAAFAYIHYLLTWPLVFLLLFPFLYLMLLLLQIVHRFDRRRSLAFKRVLAPARIGHLIAGLVLLTALMVFQGTFTTVKNALPLWAGGFPYDGLQADIDDLLHFGRAPWTYLYRIAGSDIVRYLVEWNYNQGWFVFCFGALFWVAVSPGARKVRTRYFLCYICCWIVIGNVLAGLFLSAGPAFYGHVTGDTARFAEQLAFLARGTGYSHSAVAVQAYLWSFYEAGTAGFGSGISAFPSMHVSLVTLNALFLFEHSRRLGMLAFGYAALVLASSVYLAWHYAIDGYAAVIVTVAIFLAIRRLMAKPDRQAGKPELKAS